MPNLERSGYTGFLQSEQDKSEISAGFDILCALISNPELMRDGPKKQNILLGFAKTFLEVCDRLPTKKQLEHYQQVTSSLHAQTAEPDKVISAGDFNFGRDLESFFVCATSSIVGVPTNILESLEHELDHYGVFEKNKVSVEFHLFLGRNEDTGNLVFAPAVRPKFPEDMSDYERLRIIHEAVVAPQEPSAYDRLWL